MDFVIISSPRSGTQMLMEHMRLQKNICPWGEVFDINFFKKWYNLEKVKDTNLIKEFEISINTEIPTVITDYNVFTFFIKNDRRRFLLFSLS